MSFNGFTDDTFRFLRTLEKNNNRRWFDANRERFQRHVMEPLGDLVGALADPMLLIDPRFETAPRVDRTISRVYRDTRFSRDKSPYRSNMWIVFRRPGKEWQDAPAYFFEIDTDSYRYGMGYYGASKGTMDAIRGRMDAEPEEFYAMAAAFRKQRTFTLGGELYRRPIPNKHPQVIQEWYCRKNIYFITGRSLDSDIYGSGLVRRLRKDFSQLAPFYLFFMKARY